MVTQTNQSINAINPPGILKKYVGLSIDAKPVLQIGNNGSDFFEMDTGNAYTWDGENATWLKKQ